MVQYRQHVTEIEQRIPVYVAYVLLQRQDILDQRSDRGSRQGITHRDVDAPDLLRYGVQHRDQQMLIGQDHRRTQGFFRAHLRFLAPIAQQGVDVLGLPDTGRDADHLDLGLYLLLGG